MLDTHSIARKLTDAGIAPAHADAIADAVREAAEHQDADLVTRNDLSSLDLVSNAGLAAMDLVSNADLAAMDLVSKADLAALDLVSRTELKAELAALDFVSRTELKAELKAELATLEVQLYRFLLVQSVGIVGLTVALIRLLG